MRYKAAVSEVDECWDIIDTESWTSHYEDRDNIVVATIYDGSILNDLIKAIESLDLPRTIG